MKRPGPASEGEDVKRGRTMSPRPGHLKRMKTELEAAVQHCPDGCALAPEDTTDFSLWTAILTGPKGTPFAGGEFSLEIRLPHIFPQGPPEVHFRTPVYHPNINSKGLVCCNLLGDDWDPDTRLVDVLGAVKLLLAFPNPDDPLLGSVARELIQNPEAYERTAREWTRQYSRRPGLKAAQGEVDASSTPAPGAASTTCEPRCSQKADAEAGASSAHADAEEAPDDNDNAATVTA